MTMNMAAVYWDNVSDPNEPGWLLRTEGSEMGEGEDVVLEVKDRADVDSAIAEAQKYLGWAKITVEARDEPTGDTLWHIRPEPMCEACEDRGHIVPSDGGPCPVCREYLDDLVGETSPNEAWNGWVGDQSTSEWAELARDDGETPEESVHNYVPEIIKRQREVDVDLTPVSDEVEELLLQHLINCGVAVDGERWTADLPESLTITKRLQKDGSGLGVHVDRNIADELGVDYGDMVEITIRRVK